MATVSNRARSVGAATRPCRTSWAGLATNKVCDKPKCLTIRLPLSASVGRTRKIGRAHVCTPVTNAHLVCRLLLEKKKHNNSRPRRHYETHIRHTEYNSQT